MKLSVVIPAYNEAARLPETLRRVNAFLVEERIASEIIVVDDGSKDGTRAAAEKAYVGGTPLRVLDYGGNRGKGMAVRHGFLAAKGDLVLISDADLSTPIEDYLKLEKAATERGADLVMGSRALAESNVVVRQANIRKYAGKVFNGVVRTILPIPFKDTQCGFKLLNRASCAPILHAMKIERFAFDVEMVFLAMRAGLTVCDVPIEWHNSPDSRVSFARDASRMAWDVLRVRWWWATGQYALRGRS